MTSQICDKMTGECECKANVEGRVCNQCQSNAFNLTSDNALGCDACNCDISGTVSGEQLPVGELACEHNTGQCTCLANRIGITCDACTQGTVALWYRQHSGYCDLMYHRHMVL